jgi:hypothetical protein
MQPHWQQIQPPTLSMMTMEILAPKQQLAATATWINNSVNKDCLGLLSNCSRTQCCCIDKCKFTHASAGCKCRAVKRLWKVVGLPKNIFSKLLVDLLLLSLSKFALLAD